MEIVEQILLVSALVAACAAAARLVGRESHSTGCGSGEGCGCERREQPASLVTIARRGGVADSGERSE